MTWCVKQDSCPVLLAAIEAKVEAESKARVAKSEMAAAVQAFDAKRTLFNERALDAHMEMLRSASSRKPQLPAGIEVTDA